MVSSNVRVLACVRGLEAEAGKGEVAGLAGHPHLDVINGSCSTLKPQPALLSRGALCGLPSCN
jgi:hypothetical protein